MPDPSPDFETSSDRGPSNVAVTLRACVIETTQGPDPLHAPLQPVNVEPAVAAAVSVTDVPCVNWAEQVVPQSTPSGSLVTVPDPSPDFVTDRERSGWNVAVTARASVMVTWQVPVPLHAPLQPVNVESAADAAVSVTTVS